MTQPSSRTVLRLALLACALPAAAQDPSAPSQRIEISTARHDVRTLCPTIDQDLPAGLARAFHSLQNHALVQVQFRIDGRRIADVATQGGAFETQAATRRAVRALACDNGNAGGQTVRFEVHFRLDDTPTQAVTIAQSGQGGGAN